ncbi:iron transporter [Halococcus agarilyticus]|uniref:iron transporter n=1 Tax=Halococcus agarilyticus TaxID=1232219 RepID=UPI000677B7E3|nr:iron transporter [Halococcus agarilyticus]
MDRRRYLRLAVASSVALAGCSATESGGEPGGSSSATATTAGGDDATNAGTAESGNRRGRGVYVQSFSESMYVVGNGVMGVSSSAGENATSSSETTSGTNRTNTATGSDAATAGVPDGAAARPIAGDYRFALMYAAPHVFWTVNGTETTRQPIEQGDSLHLMSVVWDPETGTVLPDVGLSVEISGDGDLVSQEVIYPMLSQRMGFHYGANFALPGDGTYTVRLSVGGTGVRRTGAFAGRFAEPASVTIEFPFTETTREQVVSPKAPRAGEPGAIAPMEMATIPSVVAPTKPELGGVFVGRATSDDAVFLVTRLSPDESPLDDGNPYLVVSARTPYNRMVLPAMALSATLKRGGSTVFEGALARTLDRDLGYHYGAAVDSARPGDRLTISVTTPPQVARHEGYENAFLDMSEMSLTL